MSVGDYGLNNFSREGARGCPIPLQDAGLLEMVTVQGILCFFINRVSITLLIKIAHFYRVLTHISHSALYVPF